MKKAWKCYGEQAAVPTKLHFTGPKQKFWLGTHCPPKGGPETKKTAEARKIPLAVSCQKIRLTAGSKKLLKLLMLLHYILENT